MTTPHSFTHDSVYRFPNGDIATAWLDSDNKNASLYVEDVYRYSIDIAASESTFIMEGYIDDSGERTSRDTGWTVDDIELVHRSVEVADLRQYSELRPILNGVLTQQELWLCFARDEEHPFTLRTMSPAGHMYSIDVAIDGGLSIFPDDIAEAETYPRIADSDGNIRPVVFWRVADWQTNSDDVHTIPTLGKQFAIVGEWQGDDEQEQQL